MRSLVCLPFTADIHSAVLNEIGDPSLLVFPTHASASLARRYFQPQWRLEDVGFVTMEELRQILIPAPAPDLQDEKRLLCLWQVLDEEDRETFHLYVYDDLVSWGQSFLSFFAEMRDELVCVKTLQDPAAVDLGTRLWQEEHLKRVLAIRERYRDFIAQLGYTDKIFYQQAASAVMPFSARKVVFVNQYYFSGLEKRLVEMLEERGCDIVIVHQGPQGSFDPLSLSAKALELSELAQDDIRLRDLKLIQAVDPDQMALACLCELSQRTDPAGGRRVLVDGGFASNPYSRWFDPSLFRFSHAVPMQSTRLYQLLSVYVRHLKALAEAKNQRFLPLAEVSRAIAVPGFVQYYLPAWSEADRNQALEQLRILASDSVLYIDLDLMLFSSSRYRNRCGLLIDLLGRHFALLDRLGAVSSLARLRDCVDTPAGLDLKRLCSTEELEHTDILDRCYERLANFLSAEELGLVTDWESVFGASGTALAADLWKLWLDHLGGASIAKYASPSAPLYETSNLMDSRNIQYDEAVLLNCVEGILPANPEAVWLLNETQRKKLGLKHYDLVRQWERYYFMRLVLSSSSCVLHCYSNAERDLEPGSYLTELDEHLKTAAWTDVNYQRLQAELPAELLSSARAIAHPVSRFADLTDAAKICGIIDGEDFLSLPCEPDRDFGVGIKSTYYDLKSLAANPFVWYIQNRRGLRQRELLPLQTITPMLFGSIMHGFLAKVLRPLSGEHSGTRRLREAFTDEDALKNILDELLASSEFDHKLPQNYNRDFLFGVISDCLVQSVRDFYHQWLEPNLRGQAFTLIPEEERSTEEERHPKPLLTFGEDGIYTLGIYGRADLRISTAAKDFIIDFKTGKGDTEQLMFYEYFYYLLDKGYKKNLSSLFWLILDASREGENTTENKREAWKEKLGEILNGCLKRGYGPGAKAADRERLKQITRADLWKASPGEES